MTQSGNSFAASEVESVKRVCDRGEFVDATESFLEHKGPAIQLDGGHQVNPECQTYQRMAEELHIIGRLVCSSRRAFLAAVG